MSDVDYIALAFEPHGNVTMRQLRRAALREREAKDVLAARLAEVEAERDEAVKLAYERIEKQNVETGKRVDLIHEREAFRADRDRLAQELEDALGHLRDVTGSAGYVDRANAMGGDKYEQTIARAVRRALREAGESQVPLTGDRLDCEKLQDLLQP